MSLEQIRLNDYTVLVNANVIIPPPPPSSPFNNYVECTKDAFLSTLIFKQREVVCVCVCVVLVP